MSALAPLILALSAMPALAVAVWSGRAGDAHARGIGLRWALIALSMFLGAAALYWAGDSRAHVYAVAIVLLATVNALLLSMVLHVRRARPRGRR